MRVRIRRTHDCRRRGAMAILIALLLPMLLALVALFLGVAHIQLTRAEMRLAADASARAATEAILRTSNEDIAFRHALAVAATHEISNHKVILDRPDVIFGQARSESDGEWSFIPNQEPYNAARVNILKTSDSSSGAVQTLLPAFGPAFFETSKTATAAQVDHNIMLVVEAGGSMHAPERWEGVKTAIEEMTAIAQGLPNKIRVGLVECHNEPHLTEELSSGDDIGSTLEALHNSLSDIKLSQGRNLGGGLELASNTLETSRTAGAIADETIIFLGNGHHTKGTSPLTAAQLAAFRGHVIYCLTFGHNADKNGDMESAALLSGGEFFEVTDVSALPGILRDLLFNPSIILIR